jgi:hypothetical protein
MQLDQLVYHLKDPVLFEAFVRSIPRPVLIQRLQKDQKFRDKQLRGFQITDHSPEISVIAKAYHKEIMQGRDEHLVSFLCTNWLLSHEKLVDCATVILQLAPSAAINTPEWLSSVHGELKAIGHFEAAKRLVRALSIEYPVEDVHVFISLVSIECSDQNSLRATVDEEIAAWENDPRARRDSGRT